jgi:alcohol dehydrogenase class IV
LGHHLPRPQRIEYGVGAVRETLSGLLSSIGCRRTVVISGNTLAKNPAAMKPLITALGDRHLATQVAPKGHGDVAAVVELANQVRDRRPDCVISFGGGSVIDLGKAVACVLGVELCSVEAFDAYLTSARLQQKTSLGEASDSRKALPHFAIPTTLSGAQHTSSAGFIEPQTHAKRMYAHPQLLARVVVLDPEMTLATPKSLWSSSGIKALDHVVEKFYAIPPHPIVDPLANAAGAVIFRELPLSLESSDDSALEYRLNLLIASWQTMYNSIGFYKSGLSHALGRQLGALCDVPHGLTSCVTLPGAIEFNLQAADERLRTLAASFGLVEHSGQAVVDGVRGLIRSLGLPVRLRDVGVPKERLTLVAHESMKDPAVRTNPRVIADAREIEDLLHSIW